MPLAPALTIDSTAVANRLRPALLRLSRELRREIHSLGVTGGQVSLLDQIQQDPGHRRARARRARANVAAPGCPSTSRGSSRPGSSTATALADRRRVGLELTGEGARVVASVKRRRTAWLAARLRGLPPDELEAIDAAVAPLLKLLEVEA